MQAAVPFRSPPAKRWIHLVSAIFLFTILVPVGYTEPLALPDIGDPSGNLMSPVQERRLGQAFMRSIRASQPVIDDPLMNSYIQQLGERLVASSDAAGRSFHFFLIESSQINAFAGPGGYIGIYSGLITTTQSESELASVVAHEIAHVTQNHLIRSFDAAKRLSLPMAALAIAALVLGAATDNVAAGVAATTGIQAGIAQSQINFTRSNEEEADSFGIQALAKADFDPQAMASFFDRMGKATRLYDNGQMPEFLRTHPVTTNRIADARGRANAYPYRQRPDSLDYHLLRARLRSLEFPSAKAAVTFFRGTLAAHRYRNEEAERYGYVLALTANREYGEARKQLHELLQQRPVEIAYLVAQADLLKQTGDSAAGAAVLKDALELYPDNYPLTIYYARLLLDQGAAGQALRLLQRQLRGRPEEAQLYKLLARAAGEAGNKTLGHRYLSEYYYRTGTLEPAIRQLQIALRDDTLSYYDSAQITARLRQMQDEQAQLQAAQKGRG